MQAAYLLYRPLGRHYRHAAYTPPTLAGSIGAVRMPAASLCMWPVIIKYTNPLG